jgi:DNA polymerase III epsilon subunit-like protein
MGTEDETDQIIEIAAAVCDILPNGMARVVSCYHALIKPMHPRIHNILPPGVLSHQTKLVWPKITALRLQKQPVDVEWDLPEFHHKGFASANWMLAVPLPDAISGFLDFWRANPKAAWIGQNPDFDLRFIRRDVRRCLFKMPVYPEVDYHTFDLASRILPLVLRDELPGVGLKHSRKWAGVPGEQTHRAMGDVQDAIAVWNALALYDHGLPPRFVDQRELQGDRWEQYHPGYNPVSFVLPDYEPGPEDMRIAPLNLIPDPFVPGSGDMG